MYKWGFERYFQRQCQFLSPVVLCLCNKMQDHISSLLSGGDVRELLYKSDQTEQLDALPFPTLSVYVSTGQMCKLNYHHIPLRLSVSQ